MLDRVGMLRWTALVVSAVALQVGLVAGWRIAGVAPDLCVLLAVCAGLAAGPGRGAMVGFAAGFGLDIALSGPLGLSALAYTLAGFGTGMLQEGTMRRGLAVDLLAAGIGAASGQLLYAVLAQLFGIPALADPKLWRVPIIVAVSAVVLARPVLALCRWAEGDMAVSAAR